MSDDTRQARIAAAMDQLFQGERGDVALGYYTVRSRMDAALKAADAAGRERERVSVAEANRQLDAYGRACVALDRARHGSTADEEVWADERAEIRRYFIALLTAAPAERGDTAETAIEAARGLLLMLHMEVMTGAILTTPAVASLMTELDKAIFAWDAADAAAAPAVGVTVDELREALVALIQAAFEHGLERGFAEYRDSGDRLTAAAAKNKQARDRVFALLTAQPELGTHDDAGHIVIPAKPEGWKP